MKPRQRMALWAVIIGSGVVFLDGSIVNLALPSMAREFNADFSGLQWIMDGYLLSLSALILLGGSLGDIYGRKRMYFIGLLGFAFASLVCGLATQLEILIAGRILQGVCGALMVPEALAIINVSFSDTRRAKAIGSWTACTAAFVAIGPLIGGYLIDAGSWRYIFALNVPLLAICYALGLASIQESKDSASRKVDIFGGVLAVLTLGALTFGLIEGPAHNWSMLSVGALAIGVIAGALFWRHEKQHKDPMLKLSLFRSANFVGANITTLAMYGALGGFFFVLLIHLQTIVGFSSLAAGLSVLPVSLLLAFSGRVSILAEKYGPRLFMSIGPIIAGTGILTLLPLNANASYVWHMLPGLMLFGVGMALTVSPLTMTVLASVQSSQSGIASAVNNAMSRVAGMMVIAVLGFFTTGQRYYSATILCACLAIGAGLLSWFIIKNPDKVR